jgi:hypothetical protein
MGVGVHDNSSRVRHGRRVQAGLEYENTVPDANLEIHQNTVQDGVL